MLSCRYSVDTLGVNEATSHSTPRPARSRRKRASLTVTRTGMVSLSGSERSGTTETREKVPRSNSSRCASSSLRVSYLSPFSIEMAARMILRRTLSLPRMVISPKSAGMPASTVSTTSTACSSG